MANFLQLPVIDPITVSDMFSSGERVGSLSTTIFDYAATNAGIVYAANVNDKLAFVCISSGYYGYTIITGSTLPVEWELTSTDYNTIYAVQTTLPSNLMTTTNFPTFDAMLQMFYNEFVEPDPSSNGVVVVVTGYRDYSDPMDEGGTSGVENPTGEFDDTSDEIPEPTLPTIGAQNSGMITLFRPSLAQVQDLGAYLWTHIDDFIVNLNKFFTNPMDYIISFHIVPCVPSVGTNRAINIGSFTTTIEMPPCVSQWYNYDFGNIFVSPYSGTYLDYSPYTKIQLMLPFIGSVTLNTDEVMNHLLGVKYHIDLLSGQFVALIAIDGSYRYQYTGACSVSVPLTGSNWARVYQAAIGAVGTAITGGMSAASGSGLAWRQAGTSAMKASNQAMETFRKASKGVASVRELASENAKLALENARAAAENVGRTSRGISASRVANTISGTVGSVMGAKLFVSHSGAIGGAVGMLGIRKPFLIIEYPNQSLAENYKHFVGYPSNISGKLSEFTGYTECEQVIPTGFTGTDEELAQVLELLKEGVYL